MGYEEFEKRVETYDEVSHTTVKMHLIQKLMFTVYY